jgi:hypothetical protein
LRAEEHRAQREVDHLHVVLLSPCCRKRNGNAATWSALQVKAAVRT